MGNGHAAQDELAPGDERVHVEAVADAHGHVEARCLRREDRRRRARGRRRIRDLDVLARCRDEPRRAQAPVAASASTACASSVRRERVGSANARAQHAVAEHLRRLRLPEPARDPRCAARAARRHRDRSRFSVSATGIASSPPTSSSRELARRAAAQRFDAARTAAPHRAPGSSRRRGIVPASAGERVARRSRRAWSPPQRSAVDAVARADDRDRSACRRGASATTTRSGDSAVGEPIERAREHRRARPSSAYCFGVAAAEAAPAARRRNQRERCAPRSATRRAHGSSSAIRSSSSGRNPSRS